MKTATQADWKTEALPQERISIRLDRTFSPQEMSSVRRGFIPEQMEDKWFIFCKDNTLFFHRSWTGFCIYIAHFAAAGDNFRMFAADVNRDPEQYRETSAEKDAHIISYLIDLLLLRKASAFPSDETSSEIQALMNWSLVGRAMFGQHPDDE